MTNLRSRWTNLILHTTSYVNTRKQTLLTAQGLRAVVLVFALILAEVWLAILSLPLYLVTQPVGTNNQEVGQYKVRRVITLSVLFGILLIWLVKLIIILIIAFSYNPKESFQINETKNNLSADASITVQIPKAATDNSLPIPVITSEQDIKGNITISGKAKPNSAVVATVMKQHDDKQIPKMYAGQSDQNGQFTITEDSNIFIEPEGQYSASVVLYDAARNVKSQPSNAVALTVHESFLNLALLHLDQLLNILVVVFIVMALFVTILTV